MTEILIPVQVGSEPLRYWDDVDEHQRQHPGLARWLLKQRPSLADPDLDWPALGFEPRWVGFDTADCVASLEPSTIETGAAEFDRFRQGAHSRRELALVISTVGPVSKDPSVHSLFPALSGTSVYLGQMESVISSAALGHGATARAAGDLSDADSQLAQWLLNCNPSLPWRSLSLDGVRSKGPHGPVDYPALGTLQPIIVTDLGEPVVAAWTSPDDAERRYIVPTETPWPLLLRWLAEHALPEYVPAAMRRARRHLATDPSLMTRREHAARAALADLEAAYITRRAHLARELDAAENDAAGIRDGLLYGTSAGLADAVRSVLEWAGVTVVDLDDHLGGTKNADLLCTLGDRALLVEVKSASSNAPERAYQDLERHLREWHHLPGSTPVAGGALIINHQHRLPPHQRTRRPYGRPEFLAAQTQAIVTTLEVFDAWRQEDADAVRCLLFGRRPPAPPAPPPHGAPAQAGRKRGWLRRG